MLPRLLLLLRPQPLFCMVAFSIEERFALTFSVRAFSRSDNGSILPYQQHMVCSNRPPTYTGDMLEYQQQ